MQKVFQRRIKVCGFWLTGFSKDNNFFHRIKTFSQDKDSFNWYGYLDI